MRDRALPEHENLLLVVDQFEELFRYERLADREEAEAFVALLLASAAQREVPIYVVLTMRSDFFGECARFEGLAETVCDSLFLCPRLTRDQIIAAIEGPARVFRGRVEPALVSRLTNDMGTDPDQLPLMQHVMMRLWDQATARNPEAPLVRLEDYLAVDGLAGSLSRHADEILELVARDAPERREVARRLFCLVTDGEGDRARRRLTPVQEVMAVADRPIVDVVRVADAYRAPGCNLMLPPLDEALTPATVLDITHEALIRNWTTLKQWAREEAASAAEYREIEQRVRRRDDPDGSPPLQPQELQSARDWIEREQPTAGWADRYGGDFERVRGFVEKAASRQKKSIWAVRLAMALVTAEAAALAVIGNNLFLIWVGIIGWIYGSVHRNLTRSFPAARIWAYGWAGFLIVVVIAVTVRVINAHQMLVSEAIGIPDRRGGVDLLCLCRHSTTAAGPATPRCRSGERHRSAPPPPRALRPHRGDGGAWRDRLRSTRGRAGQTQLQHVLRCRVHMGHRRRGLLLGLPQPDAEFRGRNRLDRGVAGDRRLLRRVQHQHRRQRARGRGRPCRRMPDRAPGTPMAAYSRPQIGAADPAQKSLGSTAPGACRARHLTGANTPAAG